MMSSFTELVRDEDQRESVYSKSLSQSYYEGRESVFAMSDAERVIAAKEIVAWNQRYFVLDMASTLNIRLDADSRERLEACKEVDQLNAWALWLAQQPRGTTVTLP